MDLNELTVLIKKVEEGQASDEEKARVLKELNIAAKEYASMLKSRIEELKNKKSS